MTERLADIDARIEGIGKLSAVVNAMRGIAAARSQQARAQLAAVDSYSTTIRAAIGSILPLADATGRANVHSRRALVVFFAEQGFVGAYNERLVDAFAEDADGAILLAVGTRGTMLARERGSSFAWQAAMPSHTSGIPRLADRIAGAVYGEVADGGLDTLDVIHSQAVQGEAVSVHTRRLIPFDPDSLPRAAPDQPPLFNLGPDALLRRLSIEYLHAQLCDAALRAFAAENEARLQAMAATHAQIERTLDHLHSRHRIVRQDEITTEIIELAAGAAASRR